MKTLLVYPPWRQPFMPPLSLTGLTAYLSFEGVACRQLDLNLETFELLLSPAWLERTGKELLSRIEIIELNDRVDGETALFHESLLGASLRLPALSRLVEEARQVLHDDERFYRLDQYREAMRSIEEALGVISLAWSPCRFLLHGHRAAAGDKPPDCPGELAAGGEERLLATLFEEAFIPSIAEEAPGLVLVLADYRSQLLPALTLLRLVRRRLPGTRTAMAGWMAEELLNHPSDEPGLNKVVDVLVSGRPEEPLLRLSRALDNGPLDHVRGLVPRGPGESPKIVASRVVPADELPPPSCRGLSPDHYFSPEPVLPVRASARAATQMVTLGERYNCRRFLLTGGLDGKTAHLVADSMAGVAADKAWFGLLDRGEPLDDERCRRLAAGGCVKLQLRMGPEGSTAGEDLLEQARQAVHHCLPAGVGIHLHCRLDEETGGAAVVEPLSEFLFENSTALSGPGVSFSCRVIRDGRLGPATGGSPPDLYNDATAPVPGAVPGFGRDPGDGGLPPESPGEEQRWRLVREAGTVLGRCRTPGTAVHDFLYIARFGAELPAQAPAHPPGAPVLEPGLILRPAAGLVLGRFPAYDPVAPANSTTPPTTSIFAAAGLRWRGSPGDGYRCRPLPDQAVKIIEQCDGVRTWEEAVLSTGLPEMSAHDLAQRLVRMLIGEELLVRE